MRAGERVRVRAGEQSNERMSGCGPTAPVGPSNGRYRPLRHARC